MSATKRLTSVLLISDSDASFNVKEISYSNIAPASDFGSISSIWNSVYCTYTFNVCKGSLQKKNHFFVTNVALWGGGGLERVHVTEKNHSLKIIFKQFKAVLETFIF